MEIAMLLLLGFMIALVVIAVQPNKNGVATPTPNTNRPQDSKSVFVMSKLAKNDRADERGEVIDRNNDGTITVKINVTKDQIRALNECNINSRIPWSGKDHGPFAIASLSDNQGYCLNAASLGRKVKAAGPSTLYAIPPDGVVNSPVATVRSLSKHGMLRSNDHGLYEITDKGLQALLVLPIRW